ncbi:MAG: FecR domain-containing protein [Cyclobacteriaceae bacterium]
MDISDYSTEDFVLDPSFNRWVLSPDSFTNIKWEQLLQKYPYQRKNASEARDILINMSIEHFELESSKKIVLWNQIKNEISLEIPEIDGSRVIPLNARSILVRQEKENKWNPWLGVKIACAALLAIGMSYLYYQLDSKEAEPELVQEYYNERVTPPGVKNHLKLEDGTRIILNANSRLKFPRSFGKHKREVFLEGEAFFEVTRDSLRPFTVYAGDVTTTVLGTAFNIREYQEGKLDIALVSGEVRVENTGLDDKTYTLKPGEMIQKRNKELKVSLFDEESIIAWTKKIIIFKNTPLEEATQVLENWYGVKINLKNVPNERVTFSGKYQDESLENVLKGLSFVGGFQFNINQKETTIIFDDIKKN